MASFSDNTVNFGSALHVKEARQLIQRLVNLVEFRGYERINLDFSRTEVAFADAVVPLIALAHKYHDEGVLFSLVLPKHEQLKRLFVNCNWAHFISPQDHPLSERQTLKNLPLRNFCDGDMQHEVVNDVMDRLISTLSHLERSYLRALEWALNEITDNVLVHAETTTGGFVQVSVHSKSQEIQLIVCDAGIGIPRSLGPGLNLNDHVVLLQESVKEGVTRGVGQGNGLYGSARISMLSGGAFTINSGNAFLAATRDGRTLVRPEAQPFVGTSIDCSISYSRARLLEQALKFGDRIHNPIDFLELKYEQGEEGVIVFDVRAESLNVGSRGAGRLTRRKLLSVLRTVAGNKYVVDFSGIGVMSSSFADEFLALLAKEIGIDEFKRKIVLDGCSEVNAELIARAFRQRSLAT